MLIVYSFILFIWPTPVHSISNGDPDGALWKLSYESALSEARAEDKLVMLYFAGSDWCKPCILLKREVFDTPTFQDFAKENLVLVKLDFPRLKKNRISKEQVAHNETLADRFNHEGAFPLVVFLDANEHVLAKSGYQPGGPKSYIRYVKGLMAK